MVMNVQIRISAQVQENYSDTDTPYWKVLKRGREFIIDNVDSDVALNTPLGKVDLALQNILDEYSNNHTRYSLNKWEVLFSSPVGVDVDKFMLELNKY
jgi:hypothetical protein